LFQTLLFFSSSRICLNHCTVIKLTLFKQLVMSNLCRQTSCRAVFLAASVVFCVCFAAMGSRIEPQLREIVAAKGDKVLIDLFVMSKCPDARRCETVFADVLKTTHQIAHVRTSYIASYDGPNKIVCKHGPEECEGDSQQLCAYEYTPADGNYFNFVSFLTCLNRNFTGIGDPDLADSCLSEAGYLGNDQAKIRACFKSKGHTLLKRSVDFTLASHITTSCTIHINGVHRCVYDGGQILDCPGGGSAADFINTICEAAYENKGKWPAVCPQPAPPKL